MSKKVYSILLGVFSVLLLDAQSVVLDTLRVLPAVHIVDTRMDLLEKGLDVNFTSLN